MTQFEYKVKFNGMSKIVPIEKAVRRIFCYLGGNTEYGVIINSILDFIKLIKPNSVERTGLIRNSLTEYTESNEPYDQFKVQYEKLEPKPEYKTIKVKPNFKMKILDLSSPYPVLAISEFVTAYHVNDKKCKTVTRMGTVFGHHITNLVYCPSRKYTFRKTCAGHCFYHLNVRDDYQKVQHIYAPINDTTTKITDMKGGPGLHALISDPFTVSNFSSDETYETEIVRTSNSWYTKNDFDTYCTFLQSPLEAYGRKHNSRTEEKTLRVDNFRVGHVVGKVIFKWVGQSGPIGIVYMDKGSINYFSYYTRYGIRSYHNRQVYCLDDPRQFAEILRILPDFASFYEACLRSACIFDIVKEWRRDGIRPYYYVLIRYRDGSISSHKVPVEVAIPYEKMFSGMANTVANKVATFYRSEKKTVFIRNDLCDVRIRCSTWTKIKFTKLD